MRFGPKSANHPGVGKVCQACHHRFKAGDFTTLILLGPGDDPDSQQRAREGRPYNAVAIEVHWACATGETHDQIAGIAAKAIKGKKPKR